MKDLPWTEASTLEQFIQKAFEEGRFSEALPLLRCLPEEKKTHYRKMWTECVNAVKTKKEDAND